jgi:lipoprotein-anchoring transpeptidase ErfK/SrfK
VAPISLYSDDAGRWFLRNQGQMRLSAFLRHCRFLTVAALGAMLAFPASAQTGSESETPSAGIPGAETPSQSSTGSESETPSTGIPGSETQSESPGAPTSSNPAVPEANPASKTTQPRKAAVPDILIVVSKPTQTMTVTVDGHVRYRWRVSTGATHYSTPDGSYTPFRMELMHYSREWDNAGMPHAIFFTQRGHSIHGSDHPGLGTAVSHGCVRLTLSNAAALYQLVKSVGMAKTKVVVSGRDPPGYRVPTMPPRQPVGLFGGFFRF